VVVAAAYRPAVAPLVFRIAAGGAPGVNVAPGAAVCRSAAKVDPTAVVVVVDGECDDVVAAVEAVDAAVQSVAWASHTKADRFKRVEPFSTADQSKRVERFSMVDQSKRAEPFSMVDRCKRVVRCRSQLLCQAASEQSTWFTAESCSAKGGRVGPAHTRKRIISKDRTVSSPVFFLRTPVV
jgi:hypothetical protein